MIRYYQCQPDQQVVEKLIELSVLWEKENSCHGYRRNTAEDIIGNQIFLASNDGQIIGYLMGKKERAEKDSSVMEKGTACFEVEELYVLSAYRNQGIGRKLFELMRETVRDEVQYITLSTATRNHKAILHFYIDELGMEFWNARLFQKIAK